MNTPISSIPQDTWYWENRPKDDKKRDWEVRGSNWVEDYKKSINHPHREYLVDILHAHPCESLLEVGANAGPNLHLFHEEFPKMNLAGIDASRLAAFYGSTDEVPIRVGNVLKIPYADKSFDCVLADAVLMYVPPEEIRDAMREICRVAKKHVILVEWHDESVEGVVKDFHYARNYTKHLEYYGFEVEMIKITPVEWNTQTWYTNGYYYLGTKKKE